MTTSSQRPPENRDATNAKQATETMDHWEALASENPAGCPCCAAGEVVAPFVTWVREMYDPNLEELLLCQAVATIALEQLSAHALHKANWQALNVDRCLAATRERCWPEPAPADLRSAARALIVFLATTGIVNVAGMRYLKRRLRRARFV